MILTLFIIGIIVLALLGTALDNYFRYKRAIKRKERWIVDNRIHEIVKCVPWRGDRRGLSSPDEVTDLLYEYHLAEKLSEEFYIDVITVDFVAWVGAGLFSEWRRPTEHTGYLTYVYDIGVIHSEAYSIGDITFSIINKDPKFDARQQIIFKYAADSKENKILKLTSVVIKLMSGIELSTKIKHTELGGFEN